jgi:hypothetical protein
LKQSVGHNHDGYDYSGSDPMVTQAVAAGLSAPQAGFVITMFVTVLE